MITLTLYSRPECHLCEQMAEELTPLLRGRARIEVVDISHDEALEQEYGIRIPVLKGAGQELSFYRLDRKKVESFLVESA